MEIRQLEHFIAAAESKNIQKAAAALGIAQPVLSRSIRKLESDVQAQLFYRNGRGVQLTQEGQKFLEAVMPLVRELLQAKADIITTSARPAGSVSLVMPPSVNTAIGARLAQAFIKQHPRVTLSIADGASGYANEWLISGLVDMAVINYAQRQSSIQMEPLWSTDVVFVSYVGKRGRKQPVPGPITFDDFCNERLILAAQRHAFRRQLDAVAEKRNRVFKVVAETESSAILTALLRAEAGSTVMPESSLTEEIRSSEFVVRRIVDPTITVRFMLAYASHRPKTFAMRAMASILRAEVKSALRDKTIKGEGRR